jgi:uncharacterized protein YggT (Ycf19 family)
MPDNDVVPIGSRPRPVSRGSQVVNYLFWLLYALLGLRLLLILMDARATGFVRLITVITDPFYAPFRGMVASPEVGAGGMVLAVPLLIALVVYALLQLAVHKLLEVLAYRQTVV